LYVFTEFHEFIIIHPPYFAKSLNAHHAGELFDRIVESPHGHFTEKHAASIMRQVCESTNVTGASLMSEKRMSSDRAAPAYLLCDR
jgi:hypothetical protein